MNKTPSAPAPSVGGKPFQGLPVTPVVSRVHEEEPLA